MISIFRQIGILSAFTLALLTGCVERYRPDDMFLKAGLLVINAHITDVPGIDQDVNHYYCLAVCSGPGCGSPTTYPSYIARATYDGETVYARVTKHCVDCREYDGSSAIKPDFW